MGQKVQLVSAPAWGDGESRTREIDLEDWDRDRDLIARSDWEGLIRHRRRLALESPGDVAARTELGEAYVLAGRASRGLSVLREAYRLDPSWPELPAILLEALFALGKDENDFEWVRPPRVARLDEAALERCASDLEARAGQEPAAQEIELWDLYEPFLDADWTTFGAWDLLAALRRDERFVVGFPEAGPEALVRLRGAVTGANGRRRQLHPHHHPSGG